MKQELLAGCRALRGQDSGDQPGAGGIPMENNTRAVAGALAKFSAGR